MLRSQPQISMTSPGSRNGCGLARVKIESIAFLADQLKAVLADADIGQSPRQPSFAMNDANASLASAPGAPSAARSTSAAPR